MSRTVKESALNYGEYRPVWLVRAGSHGEDEDAALDTNLAIIGFHDIPSLEGFNDDEAFIEHVRRATPGAKEANIRNRAAQLAAFKSRMEKGDIVTLPLKGRSQIALGRVAGPYSYQQIGGALRHTRPVQWARPDVPRNAFKQDLLYSFGAFLTVCRIQRNEAERRVAAVLEGGEDPGPSDVVERVDSTIPATSHVPAPADLPDISESAHDQIVAHIQIRFREHELARLVEAVLKAEGYHTAASSPGPDGGVDILAGLGAIGLDGTRLCVQVKSSRSPSDVKVFRELKGTMDSFKADRGLLVSWGGFTKALIQEARQSFFQVRLWDAADLVKAIYRTYDKLSEEIQTDLPLKRVWALVREELEA